MDWQKILITVFIYISDRYEEELQTACQRLSNNFKPVFTDEEVITVFLFGIMQKRFKIKDIYNYACNHLKEWFPLLPSYTAFVQRLNRLENLFRTAALFAACGTDFLNQFRSPLNTGNQIQQYLSCIFRNFHAGSG